MARLWPQESRQPTVCDSWLPEPVLAAAAVFHSIPSRHVWLSRLPVFTRRSGNEQEIMQKGSSPPNGTLFLLSRVFTLFFFFFNNVCVYLVQAFIMKNITAECWREKGLDKFPLPTSSPQEAGAAAPQLPDSSDADDSL